MHNFCMETNDWQGSCMEMAKPNLLPSLSFEICSQKRLSCFYSKATEGITKITKTAAEKDVHVTEAKTNALPHVGIIPGELEDERTEDIWEKEGLGGVGRRKTAPWNALEDCFSSQEDLRRAICLERSVLCSPGLLTRHAPLDDCSANECSLGEYSLERSSPGFGGKHLSIHVGL